MLGGLPLGQDALVGVDEVVDVGLVQALVLVAGVAGSKASGGSRDAGREGEDAEETHVDISGEGCWELRLLVINE